MDKIYLSVEPLTDREIVLTRRIDETYLGKTFSEALDYMRSEQGDAINGPYNTEEMYAVNKLNEWFTKMQRDNDFTIDIDAKVSDVDSTKVGLEDKISDYSDRILMDQVSNIDGQDVPYKEIYLQIAATFVNGEK